MTWTESLTPFFADMGVTVTFGSYSTIGLVDDVEELMLLNESGASSVQRTVTVTVPTGALVGVAVGSTIVAGGTSYVVRERLKQQDGAVTALLCRAA